MTASPSKPVKPAGAALARLRWELQRLLRGIGLPGWAGLALLAGCAGLWWGLSAPLESETQSLSVEAEQLQQQLAAAPEAVPAADGPRDQLKRFGQRFRSEQAIAPALRRLHALARRHDVTIEQAEFKFVSEAAEPLARYTILLPASAEYPSLRRFSRDLLRELPGLALEEVNLRRDDPATSRIQAQLRLVLFLTKTP
jgi:hypothetical protein